ncbi:MAG: hypothetical protein JSW64_12700 [Candidatus Zixiibacteriota bacterium]|nr:MAG: hypothetical protein JSW64_12700 [candidate division Zixibacteria bacterium]
MKSAIVFTGTGPILILTTFSSLNDPGFIEKLTVKGIKKFIAYELDPELVKIKYGSLYDTVMNDVKQSDDLRVLDYNGHNVFYNFAFSELGNPILHEPK